MEFTLKEFFQLIFKQIWIIVLCVIVIGLGTGVITVYCIQPKYQSSISFLVVYATPGNVSGSTANSDLTYSRNVVSNCVEILDTGNFYKELQDNMEIEVGVTELSNAISYAVTSDTPVIRITATTDSAEKSLVIAEKIGDIMADYVMEKYPQPGENRMGINVIDSPVLASAQSSPNVALNLFISFVAGAILGVMLVLIVDRFDTRIKGEKDITDKYNLPILGTIPAFIDNKEDIDE